MLKDLQMLKDFQMLGGMIRSQAFSPVSDEGGDRDGDGDDADETDGEDADTD